MLIARRSLERLIGLAALTLIVTGAAACASLVAANRADCNVVRLQREAGRSDAEIASALGVSAEDVGKCGGGSRMETYGAEGAGGAEGSAPAAGDSGAPSGSSSGGEPSSSGESTSGGQSGSNW